MDAAKATAALRRFLRMAPAMDAALARAAGRVDPDYDFIEHDYRIAGKALEEAFRETYDRRPGEKGGFFVELGGQGFLTAAHNAGFDAMKAVGDRDLEAFRSAVGRIEAALAALAAKEEVAARPEPTGVSDAKAPETPPPALDVAAIVHAIRSRNLKRPARLVEIVTGAEGGRITLASFYSESGRRITRESVERLVNRTNNEVLARLPSRLRIQLDGEHLTWYAAAE